MSPDSRWILFVGGAPDVALAACRIAATAGHHAGLLRWNERRSWAETSRHCSASVWPGPLAAGVSAWLERLSDWLQHNNFAELCPLDELAYELLCSGRWTPPDGVRVLGPTAEAFARGSDRPTVADLLRAAGLDVVPALFLPRGAQVGAIDLPCIARPQRAAAVEDDEPARYTTKVIASARAFDHKLRDDLPRTGLLLQALPDTNHVDLCLAARDGRVEAIAAAQYCSGRGARTAVAVTPQCAEIGFRVAALLGWTGLLVVEIRLDDDRPRVADVRCGLADGIAGADVPAFLSVLLSATTPWRRAARDPLPALARLGDAIGRLADKVTIRARATAWRFLGGTSAVRPLHRADAVLIVCKGNINRSLVAEQVLRRHGFERVASAGLLPLGGRRPSRAAEHYIEEVLDRRADALRSSTIRGAVTRLPAIDIVVCFERRHVVELLQRYPQWRGRVHLLTTLAGDRAGPIDIADPHGAADETYHRCFERIDALLRRAIHDGLPVDALAAGVR